MNEVLLSATKVIQQLDISARTLDSWYKFYNGPYEKPEGMPELPEYTQTRPRGPRFWKQSDMPALKAFKEWIPKGRGGVMGRVNEHCWSPQYRKQDENTIKD